MTTSPSSLFVEVFLLTGLNRNGSSPPSPVLDFPPILFMAIAKVECASVEIDPNDIAPVENLLTIFCHGSTLSIEILFLKGFISNKPLKVINSLFCLLINSAYFLYFSKLFSLVAC